MFAVLIFSRLPRLLVDFLTSSVLRRDVAQKYSSSLLNYAPKIESNSSPQLGDNSGDFSQNCGTSLGVTLWRAREGLPLHVQFFDYSNIMLGGRPLHEACQMKHGRGKSRLFSCLRGMRRFSVACLRASIFVGVAVFLIFLVEDELLPFLDEMFDRRRRGAASLLGSPKPTSSEPLGHSHTGMEFQGYSSANEVVDSTDHVGDPRTWTRSSFFSVNEFQLEKGRKTEVEATLRSLAKGGSKYDVASGLLDGAVQPDKITRAVRFGEEFVYPWPEIYQEWESMRDAQNHVKEFSRWLGKNAHSAKKISELERLLPVRVPRFLSDSSLTGPVKSIVRYTWIGHATGVLTVDGLNILIDPVFDHDLTSLSSVFRWAVDGVKKAFFGNVGTRFLKAATRISKLPDDIHAVLLSHNHRDHIMERDIKMICKDNWKKFEKTTWYVPKGTKAFIARYAQSHLAGKYYACNPMSRIKEMTWGEERSISCRHIRLDSQRKGGRLRCRDGIFKNAKRTFKLTMVPSIHWSGREVTLSDFNQALWGGYVVEGPKHKVYYTGDTAHFHPKHEEFKKIGQLYGPFDFSIIPIGAYEPHYYLRYQHVDPWEATKIFDESLSQVAVGCHWGTFLLSEEGMMAPRNHLLAALLGVFKEKLHPAAAYDIFMNHAADNVPPQSELETHLKIPKEALHYTGNQYTQLRLSQARVLQDRGVLGDNWLRLFFERALRFQTIDIGGSVEVARNGGRITLRRESCTSSENCVEEAYDFPLRFPVKERVDSQEDEEVYD